MNMQQLLRDIHSGQTSFKAASDSDLDIQSFQAVASLILAAEQHGYISDVKLHRDSDSSYGYYDTAFVGSITKSGRQIANEP